MAITAATTRERTRSSKAGLAAARAPVEGRQAAQRSSREAVLLALGVAILVLVVI